MISGTFLKRKIYITNLKVAVFESLISDTIKIKICICLYGMVFVYLLKKDTHTRKAQVTKDDVNYTLNLHNLF